MEKINCSCKSVIIRPIGTSTTCGTCGAGIPARPRPVPEQEPQLGAARTSKAKKIVDMLFAAEAYARAARLSDRAGTYTREVCSHAKHKIGGILKGGPMPAEGSSRAKDLLRP